MQRLGAKALVWSGLALLSAAAVGGTGCTAKKVTELVPGVSSQMVVPKDLSGVSIEVVANGRQVFCQGYLVNPATHVIDLPGTLGVLPAQSPDTVVKVTVRGYDSTGVQKDDFSNCGGAAVASDTTGNAPRVLRRSIQTYVDGHILFLPMPLSYACFDKDCSMAGTAGGGPDSACRGNQCVDPTTDQTALPDFDPTLIDGTGLCFSPAMCFPQGVTFPAATVDADQCIYTLPSYATAAAITSGVNVKVFYQDWLWQQNTRVTGKPYEKIVTNAGEEEILNEDPINCGEAVPAGQKPNPPCEGFKVLPPAADAGVSASEAAPTDALASFPGDSGLEAGLAYNPAALRIQLAQGLCDLFHTGTTPPDAPMTGPGTLAYHTISDISLSGVCQPKLPLLPICAMERNNNPVLADAGSTGDGVCNVGVPLTPAPSILYLVMDDTAVMHGALGPGGSVTTLALSFSDPVFKRTYAGFKFMPYDDQGNGFASSSCQSPTTKYTVPDEPPCTPGTGSGCPFNFISSVKPLVASELRMWGPPTKELQNALAADGGTAVCYADSDCVTQNAGTYCSKPNAVLPEGGLADAGLALDAGDDGGDAGLIPGVCAAPQALDLAAAMRNDVGAYAQVKQFALGIPTPAVSAVMFFVNRAPETALGLPPSPDGGAPEAGAADGGVSIPAFPSPVGALDCPSVATGGGGGAPTPGDQGLVPNEVLNAQQLIENEALGAFTTDGIQTYFVVLDNDRHDSTADLPFFTQIQNDLQAAQGGTAQPVVVLDATNLSTNALQSGSAASIQAAKNEATSFSNIITKLGTCLYEIPNIQTENLSATTDPKTVKIQYSTPILPGIPPPPVGSNQTTIPYNGACNQAAVVAAGDAGTAPDGWNFDTGRIRVCGKSCDNLRSLVSNLNAFAFAGQAVPDVPVTITPLCTATSGSGGSSDATTTGD